MKNVLRQVLSAGERAASWTRQLLAFSRKQALQPKVVNLNETVTHVQKMLSRVIGEDIELVSRLDPCVAPIKADPLQLQQVLMNRVLNARDAMHLGRPFVHGASSFENLPSRNKGSSASSPVPAQC